MWFFGGRSRYMPRYTILTHDHPFWHWDFLLDPGQEEPLWTWRIHSAPDQPGQLVAERLPDHRRAYLDYEGPVSQGRGKVSRWDSGEYFVIASPEGTQRFRCVGEKLRGEIQLRVYQGKPGSYEYRAEG